MTLQEERRLLMLHHNLFSVSFPGNCWLVDALSVMSDNVELLHQVFPRGQSFTVGWYAGMFHCQFCRHGIWEEVIIDDRLPTVGGELVYIRCEKPNEFWASLLEKAYAK